MLTHRRLLLTLASLAVAAATAPAFAQHDSMLVVRRDGRTLLRVNSGGNVGIATNAPDRRLVVDSGGVAFRGHDGFVATGQMNSGSIPASGGGMRMMWYPGKGAFRVGNVEGAEWDDANVGNFSVALGYGSMGSGVISTATGLNTRATGHYSTAMGRETVASGLMAAAIGYRTTASGGYAMATGLDTHASGDGSFVLGNRTAASGFASVAGGSFTTASGDYTTALGRYASTGGFRGAFVYGDASTTVPLTATAANEFSVRASGGVRFFTNAGLTAGVRLAAGSGSWTTVSDRGSKEHFLAVDGEEILARIRGLPISTWRYIAEEDRTVRHIGPMAQDWRAAFGFSADSTTINSGDLDGVNLAGVQALERRTEELRRENAALAARLRALEDAGDALGSENARLRAESAELRARLDRIEARLGPAAP